MKIANNFSEEKEILETHLSSLLNNPYIKNSKQLMSFLKDNDKDFYHCLKTC